MPGYPSPHADLGAAVSQAKQWADPDHPYRKGGQLRNMGTWVPPEVAHTGNILVRKKDFFWCDLKGEDKNEDCFIPEKNAKVWPVTK